MRDPGLSLGLFPIRVSLMRAAPPDLSALAMDRTTLPANLKPLVRRAWVRAEVAPEDARGRRLVPTLRAGAAGVAAGSGALPLALIPLFGVGISGATHPIAFDLRRRAR